MVHRWTIQTRLMFLLGLAAAASWFTLRGSGDRPTDDALSVGRAYCFAPGTPVEVMAAFNQAMHTNPNGEEYFLGGRWSGSQGSPRALTWSLVPDGLFIPSSEPGDPSGNSELFSRMDSLFGNNRALWIAQFQDAFDRWAELTGITYTRVTSGGNDWDDGASWGSPASTLRGDIRIAMRNIDGGSGVLAFNFFPSNGDMVMDRSEDWAQSPPFYRFLRNIVMHENGHGIGIEHVCPSNGTKLMEPFINTNFDGPQHDDIRAAQRHYGDPSENDNFSSQATDIGVLALGSPISGGFTPPPAVSLGATLSIDANGENDYHRFTINQGLIVTVVVSPVGLNYDSSTQAFDGSCNSGSFVNSLAIADLAVDIIDSNGSTVLATANNAGAGGSETLSGVTLDPAGDYYIRVYEVNSPTESQLYQFTLTATDVAGCGSPAECSDGIACTIDDCVAGVCTNTPSDAACDDGDGCTIDTCDPLLGCTFSVAPAGTPCGSSFSSDCNGADSCDAAGNCLLNFQPDGTSCTDDGLSCTDDFCSGGVCTHPALPDLTSCDDGDPCTDMDFCASGQCVGFPIDPCTPMEILLTPVSGTGTSVSIDVTNPLDPEILIDPGETVVMEIQVRNWDRDFSGTPVLRTVQVDLDTAALTSGMVGSISVLDLDLDDNGTCDQITSLCPICAGADLRGVFIDSCRRRCNSPTGDPCNPTDVNTCGGDILQCVAPPAGTGFADFFAELPGASSINTASNPNTLVALVTMQPNTGAIDDGLTHYVATYTLSVSSDARGTFTFQQFADGDPNSDNGGSFARTSVSTPLLPIVLGQFRITVAGGSCCFTDGSCTPDVTRPECTLAGGSFRPGIECPPPQGNGPACGCLSDVECDDLQLCTVEYCDVDTCVGKNILTFGDINNDTFASADDVNCLLDDIGGNPTSLACCDRLLGTCSGPGDSLPAADFQKKDTAPCQGCPQIGVNPDVYDCSIDCSAAPCAFGQTCVTLLDGSQVCRDPNNMGDGFISADDINAILDTIGGAVPNDNVLQPCLNCGGVPANVR